MVLLPDWFRPELKVVLNEFYEHGSPDVVQPIITRMENDERMQHFFGELFKRDRPSREFSHPALFQPVGSLTKDRAQFVAIRDLLRLAFCAARDEMSVSKIADIEAVKQSLVDRTQFIRQIAEEHEWIVAHGQLVVTGYLAQKEAALQDVKSLRRLADYYERLASSLRSPDDPLTVDKEREDRITRGVQILISAKCEELFGKRLDGVAAILASVVLGRPTKKRASRSALSQ